MTTRTAPILALLALLLPPSALNAQPAINNDQSPSTRFSPAAAVAQLAAMDLQSVSPPTESDYAVAAELLEIAHQLDPDDTEILRLLIEAHAAAGDQQRTIQHTRTLIKLDPQDTVAQLRLISASVVARAQNADDRMRVYDRFLSERAAGIDPAVRSRLALDAALLARELGDEQRFVDLLSRSIELDATNKDAASLAVSFFSQRLDDPVGKAELLINLLLADPFDAATHTQIARVLATAGAYEQAQRFYEAALNIHQQRGEQPPPTLIAETELLAWAEQGPQTMLDNIASELEQARQYSRAVLEHATQRGDPTDDILPPDDIRPQPEVEAIRIIAAASTGDQDLALATYADAIRTFRLTIQAVEESISQEQDDPELLAALQRQRDWTRAEMAWLQLWSGFETDQAAQTIQDLKDAEQTNPDAMQRLEGWAALRAAEHDRARALLDPIADTDPLADLGLAVLDETLGNRKDAARRYLSITRAVHGSLSGLYARERLRAIIGRIPEPPPISRQLDRVARAVPDWLFSIIDAGPGSSITVRAKAVDTLFGPLDRTIINLSITNNTSIPLALGPQAPINSRFIFAPTLRTGIVNIPASRGVRVVNADQRLRLNPGQTLTIPVWADLGWTRWMTNHLAGTATSYRWRILQGFRLNQRGLFTGSPFSAQVQTERVLRPTLPTALESPDQLAERIQNGTFDDLATAVLALRFRIMDAQSKGEKPEHDAETRIYQALAQRYPRLTKPQRLWVLAVTPTAAQLPRNFAGDSPVEPFDAAASEDQDPRAVAVYLVARAQSADDPAFQRAAASADPALSRIADSLRQRDQQHIIGYAGTGLADWNAITARETEQQEEEQTTTQFLP